MTRAAALRARLAEPRILVAPGAADALTARVIEAAGFGAVYVTGAGIANTSLGVPELGLTTMTEIVAQAQRIADVIGVPAIVDADTGFGAPLNVVRTVRELERAGAAAIQLEDQVSPKRCGHFEGKAVVSTEEMVQKIAAATYARRDPDLVIAARTDARAVEGFEAAVERSRAYVAAGADVIFFEAPRTVDELARLPSLVPAPLLVNMVEGGKTPLLSAAELEAMGHRIVIFPNTAMRVAMKAVQDAMRVLRAEGSTHALLGRMIGWDERQRLVGLPEYEALDRRFAATAPGSGVSGDAARADI
ncbi:MAG: isocitrate lyase/phosphoenolpyruvate mutase family protein [Chloroflexota bacterium]|nr:isocitrate lyase/phosphoenolpyruvate mutase family protein [Chloroflexota bacterium]